MGYSVACCHLCGVSFNIGRIRRLDEPRDPAWDSDSSSGNYVEASRNDWGDECEAECVAAVRTPRGGNAKGKTDEDEDEDEDEDYEDYEEREEDYERYEFEEEDSDDDCVVEESDRSDAEDDSEEDVSDGRASGVIKASGEEEDLLVPLSLLGSEDKNEDETGDGGDDIDEMERIASRGCTKESGYSGYRISIEEMRECCTLQCLFRKGRDWKPEPDDLEWEIRDDYFLSGLGDRMPSRDWGSPNVTPARHGVDNAWTDTVVWEEGNEDNIGMPFHPTCFEIFTRASQVHFGRIDVKSLMAWRNKNCTYDDCYNFPRDPAVRSAQQQWWQHERGSEYLAANPVFVPSLAPLFRSAVHEEPSFNIQHGAFATQPCGSTITNSQDPFLKLPQELRDSIVEYLPSRDIANLRLSSRVFRQLPISLFNTLLKREMPWLWEAWSSSQPYFWTTTSVPELKAKEKARDEYESQLLVYRQVIKEEMPELLEDWCGAEPAFEDIYDGAGRGNNAGWPKKIITLPRAQTNWYELYRDITAHWADLKGLQNRRRIWKDVEEIIQRIEAGRKEEGTVVE